MSELGGAREVAGIGMGSIIDTGEVAMLDTGPVTRRQKIPTLCASPDCLLAPTELAVVDCLPGGGVVLFPLCEAHGASEYETLWGVKEEEG